MLVYNTFGYIRIEFNVIVKAKMNLFLLLSFCVQTHHLGLGNGKLMGFL